jgi:hypothetical protein
MAAKPLKGKIAPHKKAGAVLLLHTALPPPFTMSNSLVVYVVVFFLFLGSYALNLTALFLPKW